MSDVWEDRAYFTCAEADGSFREHCGHSEEGFRSAVDAPASLIETWKRWKREQEEKAALEQQAAWLRRKQEEEAKEAATPRKGKTVRVVRGRKVPIGTTGECIWYGQSRYGYRVGIKTTSDAEPLWTDAKNVEVVA